MYRIISITWVAGVGCAADVPTVLLQQVFCLDHLAGILKYQKAIVCIASLPGLSLILS